VAPAIHRVLSHARWSARRASQILLQQLLTRFIGQQPLVVGIDETLERRWGPKIQARGIYRDAVRSSDSHFVKCSGLRWVSVMILTKIPWANRVWARTDFYGLSKGWRIIFVIFFSPTNNGAHPVDELVANCI